MPQRHNSQKIRSYANGFNRRISILHDLAGLRRKEIERARQPGTRMKIRGAFGSLRELVDRATDSVRPVENMRVNLGRADVVVTE